MRLPWASGALLDTDEADGDDTGADADIGAFVFGV
jgi:hypothetical protein